MATGSNLKPVWGGQVFNFRLGCFVIGHVLNLIPASRVENTAKV